jgi:hypothetical protein
LYGRSLAVVDVCRLASSHFLLNDVIACLPVVENQLALAEFTVHAVSKYATIYYLNNLNPTIIITLFGGPVNYTRAEPYRIGPEAGQISLLAIVHMLQIIIIIIIMDVPVHHHYH